MPTRTRRRRAVEIMSNLPDPIADTDAELGIERNDAWFDRVQELQKEYTKRVVEAKKLQAGHASNLAGVSRRVCPFRPSSCNCPT